MKNIDTLCVPPGWHLVAFSEDVKVGPIVAVEHFARPIVLFRTESGEVRATARHCPHLGADLVRATSFGDALVCPLHAWKFDRRGRCVEAPGYDAPKRHLRVFPTLERFGAIFVSSDPAPDHEPAFQTAPEEALFFRRGGEVEVGCPWHVIACNGYDINHFRTIHRRGFHTPPVIDTLGPRQLRVRIHAKVLGDSPRDRRIRRMTRDSIRIQIVNHGGSLLTVETDLRLLRTYLFLSLFPLATDRTLVRYTLGIPRSRLAPVDPLRHAFAFRHAERFLEDDVVSLAGARLSPKMLTKDDEHLAQFFSWLGSLDAFRGDSSRAGSDAGSAHSESPLEV